MNIPKAIEILSLNLSENGPKMPPDCRDALALGIESLKQIKDIRLFDKKHSLPLLPEETRY